MSYPACNMPQRPCVLRRWLLRRSPPSEVLARRRGGRCLLTAKKRLYNSLRLKNLRVSAWEIGSCLRIFPISMKTRNFRGEGEGGTCAAALPFWELLRSAFCRAAK